MSNIKIRNNDIYKKINTLYIDFDGTIVDYHEAEYRALWELFIQYDKKEDEIKKIIIDYMNKNKELWGLFEKNKISISDIQYQRFKFLIDKYNVNTEPMTLNKQYLHNFVNFTDIKPSIVNSLLELKKKGFKLFIVSNGAEEIQYQRIKKLNLFPIIEGYVTSERVGIAKPNPLMFNVALSELKEKYPDIDKENILIIGDSYPADITGGKKWGINTVWINDVNYDLINYEYADMITTNFEEFSNHILNHLP